MTERLTALLHREALDVPVPRPDTAQIMLRGRKARRRSHTKLVGVPLLVGGVTIAAAVLVLQGAPSPTTELPVAPASQAALNPMGWAVSAGSTIYLGNGLVAKTPSEIKEIYYTSAGIVVRTGNVAYTDVEAGDSVDSRYALVTDDGSVHSLGIATADRKAGADPGLPYLAYATKVGSRWELILVDVTTRETVASIPFEGKNTWNGWDAPPVALDGDFAYVGLDDKTLIIDWKTGATSTNPALPKSWHQDIRGGRANFNIDADMESDDPQRTAVIVSVSTGEELLSVTESITDFPGASLSPDGRYVMELPWSLCQDNGDCAFTQPTSVIHDVSAKTTIALVVGEQAGWAPDGRLIRVTDRKIDLCEPTTGACTPTGITLGSGTIKVGGTSSER